jgi:hypothetical protein
MAFAAPVADGAISMRLAQDPDSRGTHTMLVIMLAAASAGVFPVLGSPIGDFPNWFNSGDDRPSRSGAAVRFKVLLSREGRPNKCEIEASTGNKNAEAAACEIINKRFKYAPSQDAEGNPAYRILIRSAAFNASTPASISRRPALYSLAVRGYDDIKQVTVIADVEKDGTMKGCSVSQDTAERLASLGNAVCRTVSKLWEPLV